MYENDKNEKQQVAYLVVLTCCTLFTIILLTEAYIMDWEVSAPWFLLLGTALCWWGHLTKRFSLPVKLWINVILTILTLFFYGSHETSIYDLAPVLIFTMLMYALLDMKLLINLMLATYFITMLYDFIFILYGFSDMDSLVITRTLLHFAVVYASSYVIKLWIDRHLKEQMRADERVKELEEMNRRTENFLTNVSHELRTPINAVTGITTTLLRVENDREKRNYIASIQIAGQRLFNQVEDILDYTELDSGRIRLSEEPYMISSLINDILGANRLLHKKDAPELIIDLDASMPATLLGDSRKIKKIIHHLIDNGMKFTNAGGVCIKIFSIPKSYGVNLCIKVSDTGIGIAEEELLRIRERFYQTNGGRNRKAGGLGLGLPVVHGLTASMEGFVQIESVLGKGTSVMVSIPQKVADEKPIIALRNKEQLRLGCFLELEKFAIPQVRSYYNELIAGMVKGLDVPLRRLSSIDDLSRLTDNYRLTHLFIGKEEYLKYESYFAAMDAQTRLVIITNEELSLPPNRQISQIKKPFYCLSVANLLNAAVSGDETPQGMRMSCPDVRALVVDDEPMNLMVAEGILNGYQMTVKTCANGRDAIELCGIESFDLVFLDHMMPEMDGVETLKHLRNITTKNGRPLTVIAFTANAVSGAREMFFENGFDEFISKPIEICELERVLKKLLPPASIVYTKTDESKPEEKQPDANTTAAADNPAGADTPAAAGKSAGANAAADAGNLTAPGEMEQLTGAGFHTAAGISYCGGDRQFYRKLLLQFADSSDDKKAALAQLFQEADWDNYRIQIHSLKSTAKMIGADTLSEAFKESEDAAKNHDAEFIKAHHDGLIRQYSDAVACILRVLSDAGTAGADTAGDAQMAEIDAGELQKRLEQIRQALDTFETDQIIRILDETASFSYQGVSLAKLLRSIRDELDNFNYEAAGAKTDELLQTVKGGKTIC